MKGYNPVVLNMASHKRPGGGYKNGAGAQEENIFRRSNYYMSLEDPDKLDSQRRWRYPLFEFGGIYSPNVIVFKESENRGYELLPEPVTLSFIAVAAYAHPPLTPKVELLPEYVIGTKRKIKTILNLGLEHGHDCIVLSAFGCGAFKNPPRHIARLFKEVIKQQYMGAYKNITFAIIDDPHASGKGNYEPFATVFSS